ncbi:MAG: hypothetical protein KDA42_11345 [Planctomycetales bacterium]|nr:hypothetical protein [Planctomycetales bacterium]
MQEFNPQAYGPAFAAWLTVDRNRELGPGRPDAKVAKQLRSLEVEPLFSPHIPRNAALAQLCLGGLWLLYDFLDESHTISQGVETRDGSFWHGIMHRREGDFSNSKYWFRRVGDHPLFERLLEAAQAQAEQAGSKVAEEIGDWSEWDPFRFIDRCEACVRGRNEDEAFLRAVQQLEWELLFDDCYRRAIA